MCGARGGAAIADAVGAAARAATTSCGKIPVPSAVRRATGLFSDHPLPGTRAEDGTPTWLGWNSKADGICGCEWGWVRARGGGGSGSLPSPTARARGSGRGHGAVEGKILFLLLVHGPGSE